MASERRFAAVQCYLDKYPKFREALPQILAVGIKNVVLLTSALTLGFITILIASVSGRDPTEEVHMDTETITWIGPVHLFCLSVGCILSGPVTHAIGRKTTMQLITIPFFVGWLIFYFSTEIWQIFLGLSIFGFSGGFLQAPLSTYVAEVTQPHLRGTLSTFTGSTVLVGLLLQYIAGAFIPWRTSTLLNSIAPIISLVLLSIIPESPIWYVMKNRSDDAKKSLAWLRGWTKEEYVKEEFDEMLMHFKNKIQNEESKGCMESIKSFCKREVLLPLALISYIFFLGQFTGVSSISIYAVPTFTSLKVPINEYYAIIILGVTQIIGSMVLTSCIAILGRRILTFISLFGLSISLTIIAAYLYYHNILKLEFQHIEVGATHHWVPLIFVLLAALSLSSSLSIMPWILIGELFPDKVRSSASGIAGAIGYLICSIAQKLFPKFIQLFTFPGAFLMYSIIAFSGIVGLYFVLPETEGKTLQEISDHFKGFARLDNRYKIRNKKQVEVGQTVENK